MKQTKISISDIHKQYYYHNYEYARNMFFNFIFDMNNRFMVCMDSKRIFVDDFIEDIVDENHDISLFVRRDEVYVEYCDEDDFMIVEYEEFGV